MKKKQYSLVLMLALVAGLLGGMVSTQSLVNKPAFAERAKPQKVIVAEEFRVVDRQGKTHAVLRMGHKDFPGVAVSLQLQGKDAYIGLWIMNDGTPRLEIRNMQIKKDDVVMLMPDQLIMTGWTGKDLRMVHLTQSPASLAFLNEEGKVIWQAP